MKERALASRKSGAMFTVFFLTLLFLLHRVTVGQSSLPHRRGILYGLNFIIGLTMHGLEFHLSERSFRGAG